MSPERWSARGCRAAARGRLVPAILLSGALVAGAAGCSRSAGPSPIRLGTPCSTCGMEVEDLQFACESVREGAPRVYDSIECLLLDRPQGKDRVYLADYDSRALFRAESLWIVKGRFPTPMGGGFAAFASRSAADEVAARAAGRVARWSEAPALLRSAP